MNPILLAFSLCSAICFYAMLESRKKFFSNILFSVFLFFLIAITNPLFSHNGETILFFLNDNPMTLEALFYGFGIAAMIVSVIYWFQCYHILMTSDKFLYLFGRIAPKAALVVSMALRFVPLFRSQIKKINQTQKTLGLYTSDSLVDRFHNSCRVFSILVTWSLENAIITADSMKARGYGIGKRTHFSLFHFYTQDKIMLLLLLVLDALILLGNVTCLKFYYYPALTKLTLSPMALFSYLKIGLLLFLPCIIEIKENIKWNVLKSKI